GGEVRGDQPGQHRRAGVIEPRLAGVKLRRRGVVERADRLDPLAARAQPGLRDRRRVAVEEPIRGEEHAAILARARALVGVARVERALVEERAARAPQEAGLAAEGEAAEAIEPL